MSASKNKISEREKRYITVIQALESEDVCCTLDNKWLREYKKHGYHKLEPCSHLTSAQLNTSKRFWSEFLKR